MPEEAWMEDQRRQAAWDRRLARRPRCAECAEPIAQERCLDLGGGEYLCEGCIRFRMVEVDAL